MKEKLQLDIEPKVCLKQSRFPNLSSLKWTKNRSFKQLYYKIQLFVVLLYLVCSAVGVQGEVADSLKLEFVKNFCSFD